MSAAEANTTGERRCKGRLRRSNNRHRFVFTSRHRARLDLAPVPALA
jgi:hypothetical protein